MRTLKHVGILLIVVLMAAPQLQAQSKKKLRETISQLETEVQTLTQENNQLDAVNERLRDENQAYVEQNSTMRSQVGQLQRENDALRADNESLVTENEGLKSRVDALANTPIGGTNPTTGGGNANVDPNDTRKCAHNQGRLTPGVSYTENYTPVNSDGWGLQVYASRNLCQAAEKAEEFKAKYRLYKTYIRCKEVNGVFIYAVVYGSLREREQAKTYLNNFKKISGSWGANAFLVQH